MDLGKAFFILFIIGMAVMGGLLIYGMINAPPPEKVTSTIVDKFSDRDTDYYIYPDDGTIGFLPTNPSSGMLGMPVSSTKYYFKMANGDKVKVGRTSYDKYDVGDTFTYTKW